MLGGQLKVLPPRSEVASVRRRRWRGWHWRLRWRAALVRIRVAGRHGRRTDGEDGDKGAELPESEIQRAVRLGEAAKVSRQTECTDGRIRLPKES